MENLLKNMLTTNIRLACFVTVSKMCSSIKHCHLNMFNVRDVSKSKSCVKAQDNGC